MGAAPAHKNVVEGEDSLRGLSFAVVAGKKLKARQLMCFGLAD